MSDRPDSDELSDEELDAQLREVADKVIDLANQQAQRFHKENVSQGMMYGTCLLYTSPSPRDGLLSRMPSSA